MKRILFILMMLLCLGASAQTYNKVDDNTFKVTATTGKSSYQPTGKYYIAKDGVKYEIYLHTVTKGDNKGKTFCYIKRVSKKSGKSYWQKIDVKPEEVI